MHRWSEVEECSSPLGKIMGGPQRARLYLEKHAYLCDGATRGWSVVLLPSVLMFLALQVECLTQRLADAGGELEELRSQLAEATSEAEAAVRCAQGEADDLCGRNAALKEELEAAGVERDALRGDVERMAAESAALCEKLAASEAKAASDAARAAAEAAELRKVLAAAEAKAVDDAARAAAGAAELREALDAAEAKVGTTCIYTACV